MFWVEFFASILVLAAAAAGLGLLIAKLTWPYVWEDKKLPDPRPLLRRIARRVGAPGVLLWLFIIGTYLWVRVPDGSWRWSELGKYTLMVLAIAYLFGDQRESVSPYVVCTSCARKNHDPGNIADFAGWRCGYCKRETLVRVGTELKT